MSWCNWLASRCERRTASRARCCNETRSNDSRQRRASSYSARRSCESNPPRRGSLAIVIVPYRSSVPIATTTQLGATSSGPSGNREGPSWADTRARSTRDAGNAASSRSMRPAASELLAHSPPCRTTRWRSEAIGAATSITHQSASAGTTAEAARASAAPTSSDQSCSKASRANEGRTRCASVTCGAPSACRPPARDRRSTTLSTTANATSASAAAPAIRVARLQDWRCSAVARSGAATSATSEAASTHVVVASTSTDARGSLPGRSSIRVT